MKVMIVDDEEMMRDMLNLIFSEEDGVDVLCCSDGLEALDQLEEFEPNAIILDLMMPKVDGFEVCKKVREIGDPNIKIVILSGMAGDDVAEKARGLGADEVYFKPVSIDLLKAAVLGPQ